MKRATIAFAFGCAFAGSIVSSFIHPWGNPRSAINSGAPLMGGSAVPEDVRRVLEQKCADCHSEKTRWPLYSRLAPASWLVESDVHAGRSHLNMSAWPHYPPDSQIDLLTRIASEVRSGEMPVKHYLFLHPQARLTSQEQQVIYDWAKAERKRMRKLIPAQPDQLLSK